MPRTIVDITEAAENFGETEEYVLDLLGIPSSRKTTAADDMAALEQIRAGKLYRTRGWAKGVMFRFVKREG